MKEIPFVEAFALPLSQARQRLRKKGGAGLKLLSQSAIASLEQALLKKWSQVCTSCMLLELYLERDAALLKGKDAREQYLDFIHRRFLKRRALQGFFKEYGRLSQLVDTITTFWVESSIEFMSRLEQDLPLLEERLNNCKALGKVKELDLNAGDTHDEGRAVSILTFECGKCIVYKPKNLAIGQKFNALVDAFNTFDILLPLKTYKILCRENYGWEEKVEHLACLDLAAVKRYFERTGILLCLCYALHGSDFHSQNVIAAGEYPILIDLETLFHVPLIQKDQDPFSVLKVGLLPNIIYPRHNENGIDIGGLGNEEKRAFKQFKWEKLHTAEMKKITEEGILSPTFNQPVYQEKVVGAKNYVTSILSGFRKMYKLLEKNRDFLKKNIEAMAPDPIRVVLRPTDLYGYMLEDLHKAYCLADPVNQQETLQLLSQKYGKNDPMPPPIVEEEKKALLRGDIPYFISFPFSQNLYVRNRPIAENCLEKFDIKQFNEQDCLLQESLIRSTFY